MTANLALRRFVLVLALMPSVLIVLYGWRQAMENQGADQAAAKYYADSYDRIAVMMDEYEVYRLLGRGGTEVAGPGWPKIVGELPGHETGIQVTIKLHPQPPTQMPELKLRGCEIEKSRAIRWTKWRNLPGQHQWIAVAFMMWGEGGSLSVPSVVAKKKGGF
jgi:hypothetical protein